MPGGVYPVFSGGIFALALLIFAMSLAYLEHAHNGPLEAKEGLHRMLGKSRFVLLYAVEGLALPLGIGKK